jgi:hypothetical protein
MAPGRARAPWRPGHQLLLYIFSKLLANMKTDIFRLLFMLPKMNQPRKQLRIFPEQWESRRDKIQQLVSKSDWGTYIKYILGNIFEKGEFEPR